VITSTPPRFSPLPRHARGRMEVEGCRNGGEWKVLRGVGEDRDAERLPKVTESERQVEDVEAEEEVLGA
jgi:hypothetical protein